MLFAAGSCKKNGQANNDPAIVGDWTLVNSWEGNTIIVFSDFTVQRTLSFRSDGTLYETHNDSSANIDLLVPVPAVPLPKSITDTAGYQTTSLPAGCVAIKFPAIVIKGQAGCVRYSISQDTLVISTPVCLAPYSSVYVKKK
jgi:hypothetical protein